MPNARRAPRFFCDIGSSSIWFMIRTEDKAKAEALWRSCGHPLEYESYFATFDNLAQANFPIYVVEQKIGDLIMVPSLCYHQVVNLVSPLPISLLTLTSHSLPAQSNQLIVSVSRILRVKQQSRCRGTGSQPMVYRPPSMRFSLATESMFE